MSRDERLEKDRTFKSMGMNRDGQDEHRSKHCIHPHESFLARDSYYQAPPMFFTREGNVNYALQGNYRGAVAFLICNGPSFKLVDSSQLDNCFTMSLNNGFSSYRTSSWISVDDPQRFLKSVWLDPTIMKFVPYSHSEKRLYDHVNKTKLDVLVGDCPNIYYFKRNEKFHQDRFLWEFTINWGNHKKHGGGRTVFLPAMRILFTLGFRTIYLLGCDFNMSEESKYHFDQDRNDSSIKNNNKTYKLLIDRFTQLRPIFEKYGLQVFNCNKDSGLKVFDHVSYDQAIKHATGLYDLDKETPVGVYEDWEKRKKEGRL